MSQSEAYIDSMEVMPSTITREDIDNLDTDKLSNEFLKALYVINSALFVNASNEVGRLSRFKSALNHLEDELTSPEYLDALSDKDKLRIYQIIHANSAQSSDYLIKLSSSMTTGLDTISKIKAVKSTMERTSNTANIPQSKADRKELLKDVQEELKRRRGEK